MTEHDHVHLALPREVAEHMTERADDDLVGPGAKFTGHKDHE